jgi:hypothetical protein
MTIPAPVQRRTEDDLRAALAKLERLAPAADEMLSALRDPSPPRAGRRPLAGWRSRAARAYRRGRVYWGPPRPWLAVGAAAAAAAAGLTLALLPDSAPVTGGAQAGGRLAGGGVADAAAGGSLHVEQISAGQQMSMRQSPITFQHRALNSPVSAPVSTAALPSAVSLGKAMLAASGTVSKDVLYTTEADLTGGVIQQAYKAWAWPLRPAAGQRAHWRQASTQRASTGGPLKPAEDTAFSYTAPATGAAGADGRLTVVCYAGSGRSSCGHGATGTPAGSWSVSDGQFVNPGPGPGGLSLALLGHDVVTGLWQVTGRTQANGKQVIVLSETKAGSYQPMPAQMWVDAGTSLPQRIRWGTGRDVAQVVWHYLEPTPSTLALLRVKVPPGYRQASTASQ